jgi:inorganic pyrophosphatase
MKFLFFAYKELQKKKVEVGEWRDSKSAQADVEKSIAQYQKEYGKK